MDKYELNMKIEHLKKLVKEGDYLTAQKIADDIDWRRISSVSILSMVSEIYEKNHDYTEAKEILLLAYEKAPSGKRLLYKLTMLSLQEGNVNEAEGYYREFYDLAPDDPRQHILRYLILKAKNAPVDQLINSLEQYNRVELDERWMYELAEMYHQAGRSEDCVAMCDNIMLMFGIGSYVDKAADLKVNGEGVPLTEHQLNLVNRRDQYEENLRKMSSASELDLPEAEPKQAEPEATTRIEEVQGDEYDAEIAAHMAALDAEVAMATGGTAAAAGTAVRAGAVLQPVTAEELERAEAEASGAVAALAAEMQSEAAPEAAETGDTADGSATQPETEKNAEAAQNPVSTVNFMVERKKPADGLDTAIRLLRLMHEHTGSENQVVRITAGKLNERGIAASREKIYRKDLIITEAGDLAQGRIAELAALIESEPTERIVVLVDNPMQMNKILSANPNLENLFHVDKEEPSQEVAAKHDTSGKKKETGSDRAAEAELAGNASGGTTIADETRVLPKAEEIRQASSENSGKEIICRADGSVEIHDDGRELDLEEFAQFALAYATAIHCSISRQSMLALYERIEILEEDGVPLTRSNAAELINEAADRAQYPSFGKRIFGVFSPKYDKDDNLILKEEHFYE